MGEQGTPGTSPRRPEREELVQPAINMPHAWSPDFVEGQESGAAEGAECGALIRAARLLNP
jgi:hypothetical protein